MTDASEAILSDDAVPRIGSGFRLQWEKAQQAWVLLYPEGMVRLNGSAGAILNRCDGSRTLSHIVAELETEYGTQGLAADVHSFVTLALERRWLEIDA